MDVRVVIVCEVCDERWEGGGLWRHDCEDRDVTVVRPAIAIAIATRVEVDWRSRKRISVSHLTEARQSQVRQGSLRWAHQRCKVSCFVWGWSGLAQLPMMFVRQQQECLSPLTLTREKIVRSFVECERKNRSLCQGFGCRWNKGKMCKQMSRNHG